MKRIALALLVMSLAFSVAACSGEQGQRAEQGGDSIGTTTPPGTDTPADTGTRGAVGRIARVGDWSVLVVSAGPEGARGRRSSPPGTSGRRSRPAVMRIRVRVSHDSSRVLNVRRRDWTLEEGAAGTYRPIGSAGRGGNTAIRVRPGQTKNVLLRFSVPSTEGAYILRFEPRQGGPGVLRVAIP